MLSHLIRELILPPGCLLLAGLAAWALRPYKPRLARGIVIGSFLLLYLLSIPLVSRSLQRSTEAVPARTLQGLRDFGAGAVVVLGAGVELQAPEYGGETVCSEPSLARAEYAAHLAKDM